MSTHFLGLPGARTVVTDDLGLTSLAVRDLARHRAMGVVHGPAGTGKTFAVEVALAELGPDWAVARVSFSARPTMLHVARELYAEVTGVYADRANRFKLTRQLKEAFAAAPWFTVVDEAQALTQECIEFLRHLFDDVRHLCAILLVGGNGCWEVLSREPMLASPICRRVRFGPLPASKVAGAVRQFHPIYSDATDDLLSFVDAYCGHGNFRNWALFTLTALELCERLGRSLDEEVARNVFAQLGGGVDAA